MGQGQNTVYHFFIVSKDNLFQETFTVQNENESLFCLKVETKIGNVSSRYLQNENESIVLRACRFLNTRLPCTCYYFHLQIMEWIKTVLSKRNWLVGFTYVVIWFLFGSYNWGTKMIRLIPLPHQSEPSCTPTATVFTVLCALPTTILLPHQVKDSSMLFSVLDMLVSSSPHY